MAVSADFVKQLDGYGLTTAEILYRMPDHPGVLQTYLWQHYDVAPDFPVLIRFLDFWREQIEGMLYSVRVAHARLIRPAEFRAVDGIVRQTKTSHGSTRGPLPWLSPFSRAIANGAHAHGRRCVPVDTERVWL